MNATENKTVLAHNILHYMNLKGVTRTQVCSTLGIKYSTFTEWIKGRVFPRIDSIELLANYFGCDKSDLIEDKSIKCHEDDAISDQQKLLRNFAETIPTDKADLALRLLQALMTDTN